MKIRLTCLLMFFIALFAHAQQSLIPRPEKCVAGSGFFVLGSSPVVECADAALRAMADSLQAELRSLGIPGGQKSGRIECCLQSSAERKDESYSIVVKEDKVSGIYLKASDVNKDKSISAVDYVNVKNYIMGNENVIGKKGE